MKLSLCTGAALLLCSTAVLAAPDSCERVKSDIQQKIINNGVPETAFSLAIVPNDQADQPGHEPGRRGPRDVAEQRHDLCPADESTGEDGPSPHHQAGCADHQGQHEPQNPVTGQPHRGPARRPDRDQPCVRRDTDPVHHKMISRIGQK